MKKNVLILFVSTLIMIWTSFTSHTVTQSSRKNSIVYLHEQKIRSTSDDVFQQLIKQGNVIFIFYEDWCGPCKRMTPIFEELAQMIDNVLFIKAKRSLYKELFDQFGLSTIPAMIFFKDGVVVHVRPQSATKQE